jgi:hypothetical protein
LQSAASWHKGEGSSYTRSQTPNPKPNHPPRSLNQGQHLHAIDWCCRAMSSASVSPPLLLKLHDFDVQAVVRESCVTLRSHPHASALANLLLQCGLLPLFIFVTICSICTSSPSLRNNLHMYALSLLPCGQASTSSRIVHIVHGARTPSTPPLKCSDVAADLCASLHESHLTAAVAACNVRVLRHLLHSVIVTLGTCVG